MTGSAGQRRVQDLLDFDAPGEPVGHRERARLMPFETKRHRGDGQRP